jgi:hypothetical protein
LPEKVTPKFVSEPLQIFSLPDAQAAVGAFTCATVVTGKEAQPPFIAQTVYKPLLALLAFGSVILAPVAVKLLGPLHSKFAPLPPIAVRRSVSPVQTGLLFNNSGCKGLRETLTFTVAIREEHAPVTTTKLYSPDAATPTFSKVGD